MKDVKEEVVTARQQLVKAYHDDVLHRWNAKNFVLASVESDLTAARLSSV